jgi:hypothetical protein
MTPLSGDVYLAYYEAEIWLPYPCSDECGRRRVIGLEGGAERPKKAKSGRYTFGWRRGLETPRPTRRKRQAGYHGRALGRS